MHIHDDEYAVSELALAKQEHYEWAGKILRLSLLGGDIDHDILEPCSHQRCRFSRWLSRNRNDNAADKEWVRVIDEAHTQMHNVARELMHSIMQQDVTDSLLINYQNTQQKFIRSLDEYKEYLFSRRHLHDNLTGLPLRHLLHREFPLLRAQCQRTNRHLYLLMMDIDHFKSINDTWGHNAGDEVLRNVAMRLKKATRKGERIYRFGGEEFIVLLEAENEFDAQTGAQRIQQYLQQHPIRIGDEMVSITVTAGLSEVAETDSLHEAIGRADKAMYYGKNTGRNRCIMSTHAEQMIALG